MYRLLENRTLDVIARSKATKQSSNVMRLLRQLFQSLLAMTIVVAFFIPFKLNAFAFNEFQTYIEQKSKKQLNCAYCHSHVNGPNGNETGQLGSLSEEQKQLTAYNQFLSVNKESVDSPILNEFGNYLVKKLGYDTIVKAQDDPDKIVEVLKESDLDQDGINDLEEVLDGTLPNDPLDGNPFKLFVSNIKKKWMEVCFQVIALVLLIVSLCKLKM